MLFCTCPRATTTAAANTAMHAASTSNFFRIGRLAALRLSKCLGGGGGVPMIAVSSPESSTTG